jgi:collagenase-like PrtC family protease
MEEITMQITLAPIPFYWPKETVFKFYDAAQQWSVDRIVLGENVCSKRRELSTQDWLTLADKLRQSGKDVAISTLALLEAESELKTVRALCEQDKLEVEANDFSAVELLNQQGVKFSAGPYLNIYNPQALRLLMADGLTRWTLPVELGHSHLVSMQEAMGDEMNLVKTEVFAHGYLPLALSARCFTARALEKPKDQCKRVCLDYPTGIAVDSQESQRLFTLNGIQTLSGEIQDLVTEVPRMQAMGVDAIRISPSQFEMEAIVEAYASAIQGEKVAEPPLSSSTYCDGYWHNEAGLKRIEAHPL